MEYDVDDLPLGSVVRAKAQLQNNHLHKAIKTCKTGAIALDLLQPELKRCLDRLYKQKVYGTILSAYYEAGEFGYYSVDDLLRLIYTNRDYPTFLKQAYRFNAYDKFRAEIQDAINWHYDRNLHDASAWAVKFAKLQEQERLRTPELTEQVLVHEEMEGQPTDNPPQVFELKPMHKSRSRRKLTTESTDDPYIISQTARVKLEQANTAHKNTLSHLGNYLRSRGLTVSESKLIDAYSVLADGPAIFEVKSITESNEREQIRHAVSQLYEYRFLHQLVDASLWVVFAVRPYSDWYVNYLTDDRGLRVIWVHNEGFDGPSVQYLV